MFQLARWEVHGYRRGVNGFYACLCAAALGVSSCERKSDEAMAEARPLTTRDRAPLLDATSDQRFRDAKPSPVNGEPPAGWLAVPPTQIRLLNYRFGETGLGEVWVSISSGTVQDNVNRWLKQFGLAPVEPAAFEAMPRVPIAETTGVWVEAAGNYAAGMGAEAKTGYGLAGIVASQGDRILTVKMIGPAAEVKSSRAALEAFAKSLKTVE